MKKEAEDRLNAISTDERRAAFKAFEYIIKKDKKASKTFLSRSKKESESWGDRLMMKWEKEGCDEGLMTVQRYKLDFEKLLGMRWSVGMIYRYVAKDWKRLIEIGFTPSSLISMKTHQINDVIGLYGMDVHLLRREFGSISPGFTVKTLQELRLDASVLKNLDIDAHQLACMGLDRNQLSILKYIQLHEWKDMLDLKLQHLVIWNIKTSKDIAHVETWTIEELGALFDMDPSQLRRLRVMNGHTSFDAPLKTDKTGNPTEERSKTVKSAKRGPPVKSQNKPFRSGTRLMKEKREPRGVDKVNGHNVWSKNNKVTGKHGSVHFISVTNYQNGQNRQNGQSGQSGQNGKSGESGKNGKSGESGESEGKKKGRMSTMNSDAPAFELPKKRVARSRQQACHQPVWVPPLQAYGGLYPHNPQTHFPQTLPPFYWGNNPFPTHTHYQPYFYPQYHPPRPSTLHGGIGERIKRRGTNYPGYRRGVSKSPQSRRFVGKSHPEPTTPRERNVSRSKNSLCPLPENPQNQLPT